ncbi:MULTISPECIES: flagellar hook-basal body complex protein FliE [unclassified Virgibacillus]|uniref:flagellar hook-basal body complex protein FliE n=1 Tax=unclassified Virgibacillus TaxID=2620237 RepID=UPI0024DE36FF|nr:flagellar hook-basal body complex protein FliE [Virgibacillus sp. LDC-1]
MLQSIQGIQNSGIIEGNKQVTSPGKAQAEFGNTLKKAIEKVNEAQTLSDKKTELLAAGKIDDLHDVMITAQKASITLETAVQIQRKAIDAYNEVMRMQV